MKSINKMFYNRQTLNRFQDSLEIDRRNIDRPVRSLQMKFSNLYIDK